MTVLGTTEIHKTLKEMIEVNQDEECLRTGSWPQAVARIGVEGFKQLLICTGKNMKPQSWQKAGSF